MSTTMRSVCPYDCPDTCGLLVQVEGGRAVKVSGDPEHPFTRGFLCPKMYRYHETVHSPKRLTTPLLRSGPKGSGSYRPIGWEEALERIGERWTEIIARHGAEAILPYSFGGTLGLIQRNAGHPFFHRLGASQLARTICTPAKEAGWEAVMGETPAPHPDAVAESDLVLLWGVDAVSTNIHYLPAVRRAQRRGAKVWLIETYRTPTSDLVDRTVLVRPGSDGALALGLMHLLVRDGRVDEDFVREWVQGFDELCAEVLPGCAPRITSERTGVPVPVLEELARLYGSARAPMIRLGSGLSRYANGGMAVRCIVSLPALTGAYGRRGGGCFADTSTGAAFALEEVTRPDFLARPTRTVNMNRLGEALLSEDEPPIQGLYVYHANPAASTPDQNRVLAGLSRQDLFTVVHERFLTDTARYADLVLPATSSLEHSDLYRAYGSYCIQRASPVIAPVGESRSNWQTFSLLAEAMGFDEPFFNQSEQDLIERLLAVPRPMRSGIDLTAMEQGRPVELAVPPSPPFATPSGRIEIRNPLLSEPLLCWTPPAGGDHPFRLMTAPARLGLNSSFAERPDLIARRGAMELLMSRRDAEEQGLKEGERVRVRNDQGEADFILMPSDRVPTGVVVAQGIWWLEQALGRRTVNALTSSRLTDLGEGSTLYDNTVSVERV